MKLTQISPAIRFADRLLYTSERRPSKTYDCRLLYVLEGEGEIVLDLVGKRSGRGAYLCKSAACLKKARKSRRIDASLDCRIDDGVYERLEEEISRGV